MSITVLRPGLLTTVQDLGRYGYQKYGVIVSGAMDAYSLRVANLLVGNAEGEAGLEITLMGPVLRFERDMLVAITGGDLSPTIAGKPVPLWRPVYIQKGSILKFGHSKSGCRAYLAVAGGYNISSVMGSKSTYQRAGIGGFKGRAMQADDVLEINSPQTDSLWFIWQLTKQAACSPVIATPWYAGKVHLGLDSDPVAVRVMRGGQFEQFTDESKAKFWDSVFQVTPQSDRMGYRLSGSALLLAEPLEMVSEAVALGTIQVPPDGNPIVLLADRQTTGGYPKMGQVALVDVAKVAQIKPGGKIRFEEITVNEAARLYREREKAIDSLRTAIGLKLRS
ncbi:biotin-dependent carboxyltransferase family protein [Sporomusa sp.]|uniref:5-oxoprolinase subunit C family protein n=1 Tax=Sporomusa sp. TaxID=2078658 RepID=UPI002C694B75|nr:biotin-dependent carboxyltransferase family protein [Sporomusa sp.]HWR45609.1 biotin-dependent carboxyltransferase family protein [Sporomusa sp.]